SGLSEVSAEPVHRDGGKAKSLGDLEAIGSTRAAWYWIAPHGNCGPSATVARVRVRNEQTWNRDVRRAWQVSDGPSAERYPSVCPGHCRRARPVTCVSELAQGGNAVLALRGEAVDVKCGRDENVSDWSNL